MKLLDLDSLLSKWNSTIFHEGLYQKDRVLPLGRVGARMAFKIQVPSLFRPWGMAATPQPCPGSFRPTAVLPTRPGQPHGQAGTGKSGVCKLSQPNSSRLGGARKTVNGDIKYTSLSRNCPPPLTLILT